MGKAVKVRTSFIVNSILTFGLLESSRGPISKAGLAETLGVEHDNQVARYIMHLREWLSDSRGNIIRGSRLGYRLQKDEVPEEVYEDFLTVLLVLNILHDRPITLSTPLMNMRRKGSDVIGIVTSLLIARNQGKRVRITCKAWQHSCEFDFKPEKIFWRNGCWVVGGSSYSLPAGVELPLDLYNIRDVKLCSR
jgi:hypothetical protein